MKKDKNRKLHGSVLLTVVFVMSILIIFLFGTLTLALAANNRAHVNYSSAQTGITARAVAESAIKAISNSSQTGREYAAAVDALTPDSDPIKVPVKLSGDGINSLGDVEPVEISYAGTKEYYDPEKLEWQTRDLIRFTATVNMAGVRTQSSIYALKLDKTDAVESSGGGAGFVTTAEAVFKTQTSLFGGSYINLPHPNVADKYIYEGTYEERMNSRTFNSNPSEHVYLENSDALIEADLVVNNDVYVQNWSGIVFPSTGKGVTIWGDLTFDTNAYDHFNYIFENSDSNLKSASSIAFNEIPYIYVDGKISGEEGIVRLGNKDTAGNPATDFPLNTFCGSIVCGKDVEDPFGNTSANGSKSILSTNLYCMDADGNSIIKGTKSPGLYNWSGSVISRVKNTSEVPVIKGEVCSKGNLELDNVEIAGDLRVQGNLIVGTNVSVKGKIVCGGTITNADKITCNEIYNNKLATEGSGAETADVELKNLVGYYYVYTPIPTYKDGKEVYIGAGGENDLLNDKYFEGGILKEEYNDIITPSDLRIYYALQYGWKQSDYDSEKYIDFYAPYMYEDDPALEKYYAEAEDIEQPAEGNSGENPVIQNKGFYIKTEIELFEAIDNPSDNDEIIEINEVKYKYVRVPDGYAKTDSKTFKETVVIKGSSDASKCKTIKEFKNKYNDQPVYPKYAERKTILGRDTTLNKQDTKIVMTLDEVLKDISNPYKSKNLPTDVAQKYETVKKDDELIFESKEEINAYFCVKDEVIPVSTNDEKPNYQIGDKKYNMVSNATNTKPYGSSEVATYISSSCIIEGNATVQSYENHIEVSNDTISNDIIIDPKGESIVIGIKGNVAIAAGANILINDDAGKVYFYIEPGASLCFNGNNMCTKEYWTYFNSENKNFSYNCDSDKTDNVRIDKEFSNPCPNVYIFGDTGSKMIISNMKVMTMNVISPEIAATVRGGAGNLIDSFYYNGYNVAKRPKKDDVKIGQYVIGCFNVNNCDSKNQINVIYVPDGNNGEQVTGTADNTYKCKILYYSEF